ncbi:hypothetical protein HANVADRAFT_56127 [Hanseniaspora valbyensis NRRL Y-1626]|uniref:t-SNARE coiled-coil homology domain-containing protein n=1 Tax=Hanseniaspora valbyensis NRRL Y-1626 TaxID=766949 RepID=A0A1B7TE27_9ASCO|nr:hypothetical protein HANVADRAFT_56127 [Hanseniaspora valbyensis NRRL Y-1626]
MSFLDLESGNVDSSINTNTVQDDENQILYDIITKLTDAINLMNRYIQTNTSNISTNIIDKKIFDCDDQIMIYNNNNVSEENKSGVRFKLEHDLKEIISNYESIKRKYYNKKIMNNKKNNNNKAAAAASSLGNNSYGSISIPALEEEEAAANNNTTADYTNETDQYQSFPLENDNNNSGQRQLLLQEEEQEQLNQQDLDIHTLSVQAHSESVARIQKQVTEVNQIFHNLNDLIVAQNSKVVTIEDNLNQFHSDVERSEGQLKKAERELYKRGNCTLVALVAFSIVTLLFVILAI